PHNDPSLPSGEIQATDPSAAVDRTTTTRVARQNPLPSASQTETSSDPNAEHATTIERPIHNPATADSFDSIETLDSPPTIVNPYVLNPPRRDEIRPAQVPTIRIVHPEPTVRIVLPVNESRPEPRAPTSGKIRMAEEPTNLPPGTTLDTTRSTNIENPQTAARYGGVVRQALPPRDFNSSLTPPPLDAVIVDRRATSRPETDSSRQSRGPVTAAPRFFHEERR
ncbi:MAG: hypothetical protein KDA71_21390, partial [Planctomycetales bacterium]|nr:hypothetical protein [Planctomycetales bacterium]